MKHISRLADSTHPAFLQMDNLLWICPEARQCAGDIRDGGAGFPLSVMLDIDNKRPIEMMHQRPEILPV